MYQLFYGGEEPPKVPNFLKRKSPDDILWGNSGKDAHVLATFCRLFGRLAKDDRKMLFVMAQKMGRRKAA